MTKFLTLFLCAVLFGATSLLTGCQGTPKRVAYKTLKITAETVDSAMTAYAEAVVLGLVHEVDQAKVRALHDQYRIAFVKAVAAAEFDYENATPGEVAGLASGLVALVAAYTGGLSQ